MANETARPHNPRTILLYADGENGTPKPILPEEMIQGFRPLDLNLQALGLGVWGLRFRAWG